MSLTKVESDAQKDQNLLVQGRSLYQLNCATCHGIDLQGQGPFPSLAAVSAKLSRPEALSRVKEGKGQMPAFPHLKKKEQQAIISYLFENKNQKLLTTDSTRHSQPDDTSAAAPSETALKYAHSGYGQFLDEEGYPAVKPPWGTLNAINLNTGELLWKVPLGEYAELTKRGIPPTGTQNFGGTLVTKGGLVFIGGSKDERFRAFDKDTGEILWETLLPAGGYATPSTYEIKRKQYVVIAAGGGGKNATKTGDAFVVFSLPDTTPQ